MNLSLHVAFDHTATIAREMRPRVKQANRKTALDVQGDWAAGVRVDTGNLKNSIAGSGMTDVGETGVEIGTNVEYAVYENYGTRRMSGSFAREKAVEKHRSAHAEAVRQALSR